MKIFKPASLAVATLTLLLIGTASATAAQPTAAASATTATPTGAATVITGGKTQSVDPTRYDYVAPKPDFTTQSATGAGYTTAFTFEWKGANIGVPTGWIAHTLNGNGLKMDSENARWDSAIKGVPIQICNYQWYFQNRYGSTIYATIKSPLFTGCDYGSVPTYIYGTARTVKTGDVCARLYVGGTFRGEQCHHVYP